MENNYTYKSVVNQIKTQKNDFFRTSVYGIVTTLLLLPIPMLIPLLIDEVLLKNTGKMTELISSFFVNPEVWVYIVILLGMVILLRVGAFYFNNKKTFYAIKITQKIAYVLRHRILHHLERVSLSEYESIKSGGIASKMVQDVESVSGFAGQFIVTIFSATLMLVGVTAIMIWMNWALALFVFILNPMFLGVAKLIGNKMGVLLRRQHEAYDLYHELLNETLELFVQVRASNQERSFFSMLQKRAKNIETTSLDYGYKASIAQSSSTLLTNTVVDIFRALGVAAVAYSDLSVGMMIAFLFYLSTIVAPVQQLMGLVIAYQHTKPAFSRINTLFSLSEEPHYPHVSNPFEEVKTTSVSLKNINFSYNKGTQVLYDISLRVKKGETIALIGPSGSGKTTLAQILVGFYQVEDGEIVYGDVPIEKIGLPIVRNNVALMLQQSLFFNDSIRRNLTLSEEKSDAEIFDALKAAQLDEFVHQLGDGLETLIGKNGIRLSGGQRQRLAIARLILSDPKIVIFDEATSALDNATEFYLYETLQEFLRERTTIIIAHRTTTIKQADYIYLIEKGRVKAEGTYEKLEEKGYIREDFDVT